MSSPAVFAPSSESALAENLRVPKPDFKVGDAEKRRKRHRPVYSNRNRKMGVYLRRAMFCPNKGDDCELSGFQNMRSLFERWAFDPDVFTDAGVEEVEGSFLDHF